jgi:hypothetical protein
MDPNYPLFDWRNQSKETFSRSLNTVYIIVSSPSITSVCIKYKISAVYVLPTMYRPLTKHTPWFQSAKRTIPTERPPLVGEVSAHFSR